MPVVLWGIFPTKATLDWYFAQPSPLLDAVGQFYAQGLAAEADRASLFKESISQIFLKI